MLRIEIWLLSNLISNVNDSWTIYGNLWQSNNKSRYSCCTMRNQVCEVGRLLWRFPMFPTFCGAQGSWWNEHISLVFTMVFSFSTEECNASGGSDVQTPMTEWLNVNKLCSSMQLCFLMAACGQTNVARPRHCYKNVWLLTHDIQPQPTPFISVLNWASTLGLTGNLPRSPERSGC